MIRVRIRASSISGWLDCAYRAACLNPDIYGKHAIPASGRAWTGTAVHRASAVFDQATHLERQDMRVTDAVDEFVQTFRHPDEEVNWADERPSKIEAVGIKLMQQYAGRISPTLSIEAVESSCDPIEIVFEDLGVTIELTGTLDRRLMVKKDFGRNLVRSIADLKTGLRIVGSDGRVITQGHECQLGVYEVLDERTTGKPLTGAPAIIGLGTTDKARVGIGHIPNARDAVFGTDDYPGQIEHIARMISVEAFPGNPRSMMCSEKYCAQWPTCPYRGRT